MKAIETEYKKQISQDIPDLWARIEAGVDEYEKTKVTEEKVVNIDINKNRNKNSNKTIILMGKILGAVASIAIVATVVLNFGTRTKSETAAIAPSMSTQNFVAASDSVAESCADEAEDYWDSVEETAGDSMESSESEAVAKTPTDINGIRGNSAVETSKESAEAVEETEEDATLAEDRLISNILETVDCSEDSAINIAVVIEECGLYNISGLENMYIKMLSSDWIMNTKYWSEDIEVFTFIATDSDGIEADYNMVVEYAGEEAVLKAICKGSLYEENYIYETDK